MATISEINQGSSYTGNAAIGGRGAVGITIDTSPLQRLQTFTYYRDRDLWEKKNADDKVAADKIAAMSAYDITSPLKPFSEDLKSSLAEIQKFVRDNPDSLVYSRNPEKYQKREELINSFLNKRKGATANDVLYNAQKSAIEKIADPAMKEIRRRELDNNVAKLFGEGLERAYNTQINSLPELKPSDYKIPTVALTSRSFIDKDPNSDTEITVDYVDIDDARTKSALTVAQPMESIDETAPWFQKLPENEKQIERDKAALSGEKRRSLQKLSSDFNSLLGQWVAANPNVDINTVDPNSLPDGTLENNVKSVIAINKQIDELNSLVKQGKIVDKGGFVRTKEYEKINFQNGLAEDEVTLLASLQENGNAIIKKVGKNIKQNDNAIQLENIRTQRALGWANLNWDKDKFKQQTQGTEQVKNGATIFAERMYNELKALADPNGVIPPDKLRRLTTEQLKYLGYDKEEVDAESGKVTRGLKPLAITPQDESGKKEKVDAIQLVNGQIRILQDAKKIPNSNSWEGLWDQTRSTTVSNIATNRLNEQLSKAGAKELNSYIPLDMGNIEVQSTTSGGGTTVSGSSSTGGNGRLYNVIDPRTGAVIGSGVSKEQADIMAKKGYTIQ